MHLTAGIESLGTLNFENDDWYEFTSDQDLRLINNNSYVITITLFYTLLLKLDNISFTTPQCLYIFTKQ